MSLFRMVRCGSIFLQQGQIVTSRTFIAAMENFFKWLNAEGIQPHNTFQDGATTHTENAVQAFLSERMVELLCKVH